MELKKAMITELNAHSIAEIIRTVDAELLPKMSKEELWCHIQSYTLDDTMMEYVYSKLEGEEKQ